MTSTHIIEPEYLTVTQAALKFGCSTRAVWRAVQAGRLRSARLHPKGKHLIPVAELATLLTGKEGNK